jgi:hypothetical protein
VYVLFNTNCTLLSPKKQQAMIDTGLDELRVALDAADARTFLAVRGKNFFERIVRNVRGFTELQRATGAASPRVSLWLTGLKETIEQLPAFVRLAESMGVREVYLQRLVYDEAGYGLARPESTLFETLRADGRARSEDGAALARDLGIALDASGATEPGLSLKRQDATQPWSACRRPWSLMYFTAHGRALPCCMAPFSARGYDSYTLGDATQQTLREIWNGAAYQDFRAALLSDAPARPCAGCGVEPLIIFLPQLGRGRPTLALPLQPPAGGEATVHAPAVILTLNEPVKRSPVSPSPSARRGGRNHVADSSSRDGTAGRAFRGARVVTLTERGHGAARRRRCGGGRRQRHHPVPRRRRPDHRADLANMLVARSVPYVHFVIGSRVRGERRRGSMRLAPDPAGRLAGWSCRGCMAFATPTCARAISREACTDMREIGYG